MTFQISDIPRILPELMLLVLALLVLGSDIFERWGTDAKARTERRRSAGQLTVIGLGIILVVALIQSRFLFVVPEPGGNWVLNLLLNLGRNLQAGGPGGSPILGAFMTDELTALARLMFIGIALLTALLTLDYPIEQHPGEFYALLLSATLGLCVMAAANEFLLAYLGLELSSIALYVLAGYFRADRQSSEAGLKYFLFGVASSAVLLYGISLIYGFTASAKQLVGGSPIIATSFSSIANFTQGEITNPGLLNLAFILIVAGLGYKITAAPFHSWSPDVYQGAPTPVSAFLSTASLAAGFLLIYRILTAAFVGVAGSPALGSFGGWTGLIALLALLSVLLGNLAALVQTNAKRLLAYSGISHAGFALLALTLWDPGGIGDPELANSALLYYLIAYTITNLGAFAVLTVLREQTGGDDLRHLNGLWRRSPFLALVMTILILSLAGIPPLAGFWAKFFVFIAGFRAGAGWIVAVAIAMTVVSLAYYLYFIKAIWMAPPNDETQLRAPRSMQAVLVVTTALTVVLGLFPNLAGNLLDQIVVVASR
jgi:NADH-quinone oxidoreductase subunit N